MAPFSVSSLKSTDWKAELQPNALKNRAQGLQDRFSSAPSGGYSSARQTAPASTSSASGGRTLPPATPARLAAPSPTPHARATATPPPPAATAAAQPPPPPPRRGASTGGDNAPPPPPRRSTLDTQVPEPVAPAPAYEESEQRYQSQQYQQTPPAAVNWQNISRQDKQALFSSLDTIFGNAKSAPRTALRTSAKADVVQTPVAPAPHATKRVVTIQEDAPLTPTRSGSSSTVSSGRNTSVSYPPPCKSTSHAHDIADYFTTSQSSAWTTTWFTSDAPLPPPLRDRSDMTWTSSWSQLGSAKTLVGAALFCDLSVAWWKVEWSVNEERQPGFAQRVRREARYLDCPEPFEAPPLWEAFATYGEQITVCRGGSICRTNAPCQRRRKHRLSWNSKSFPQK